MACSQDRCSGLKCRHKVSDWWIGKYRSPNGCLEAQIIQTDTWEKDFVGSYDKCILVKVIEIEMLLSMVERVKVVIHHVVVVIIDDLLERRIKQHCIRIGFYFLLLLLLVRDGRFVIVERIDQVDRFWSWR